MSPNPMNTVIRLGLLGAVLLVSSPALAKGEKSQCAKHTAELDKRLAEIPDHVGLGLSPLGLMPPEAEGAKMITERGVVIDLTSQGLAFEGQRIAEGHAALDDIIGRIPEVEKLLGGQKVPVYMRVDRRTPIDTALGAICRVAEKRSVRLVVQSTNPPKRKYAPPEPPEAVKNILTNLAVSRNPAARAKVLSQVFDEAIGTCESVRAGVALVNMVPPEERAELMKRAVVEGLNTCRCEGAKMDVLESLLILMMAPISPPSFAISPELPCGQKRPYGLKPTLNYAVLIEKLAAR